jgi:rhodanese-related sulfurtransferase
MSKKILISALAAVAAVLMIFTACSPQADSDTATETQAATAEKVEIINNTPEEFEANMEGDYLLLDVRTQEEYDAGHIEGSTLIPVDELGNRISEIEDYKDKTVLVYCRSGNRSVTASNILISNGFNKVHNLLGGIGAWNTYKGE